MTSEDKNSLSLCSLISKMRMTVIHPSMQNLKNTPSKSKAPATLSSTKWKCGVSYIVDIMKYNGINEITVKCNQ